jgi:hypothetical protein
VAPRGTRRRRATRRRVRRRASVDAPVREVGSRDARSGSCRGRGVGRWIRCPSSRAAVGSRARDGASSTGPNRGGWPRETDAALGGARSARRQRDRCGRPGRDVHARVAPGAMRRARQSRYRGCGSYRSGAAPSTRRPADGSSSPAPAPLPHERPSPTPAMEQGLLPWRVCACPACGDAPPG